MYILKGNTKTYFMPDLFYPNIIRIKIYSRRGESVTMTEALRVLLFRNTIEIVMAAQNQLY